MSPARWRCLLVRRSTGCAAWCAPSIALRMRFSWPSGLLVTALLTLLPAASAARLVESTSLNPCQANSSFTASLFNIAFTPDNRTVRVDVVGVSSISGNVTAEIELIAYGYTAVKQTVDPCKLKLDGLCPMNTGQINIQTNFQNISDAIISKIPGMLAHHVASLPL